MGILAETSCKMSRGNWGEGSIGIWMATPSSAAAALPAEQGGRRW